MFISKSPKEHRDLQRRETLPADPKGEVAIHLPKVSGAMSSLKGICKQSPHRLVPWDLKDLVNQRLYFRATPW